MHLHLYILSKAVQKSLTSHCTRYSNTSNQQHCDCKKRHVPKTLLLLCSREKALLYEKPFERSRLSKSTFIWHNNTPVLSKTKCIPPFPRFTVSHDWGSSRAECRQASGVPNRANTLPGSFASFRVYRPMHKSRKGVFFPAVSSVQRLGFLCFLWNVFFFISLFQSEDIELPMPCYCIRSVSLYILYVLRSIFRCIFSFCVLSGFMKMSQQLSCCFSHVVLWAAFIYSSDSFFVRPQRLLATDFHQSKNPAIQWKISSRGYFHVWARLEVGTWAILSPSEIFLASQLSEGWRRQARQSWGFVQHFMN